ncbi:FAD/NAD(P)-binding domain-containing protein [Sistotremastrum niveocremeum HHB9708]|uniref:FAD/NAD(P)-binding domain-containing protein n=1 Tax=Sistotremastrum niveocremeum HHB9708 TaxID=1314777 RepID=A0A164YPA2_9AGAM|nr:FAD/NAD(P)-binding domain-containing protein [Sistotremastrum niveocremeum HHB9708]
MERSHVVSLIREKWLSLFSSHCFTGSPELVASLFLSSGWWRDHLCLSWDFHTKEGPDQILAFLSDRKRLSARKLRNFQIDRLSALGPPKCSRSPGDPEEIIVEASIIFDITKPVARGRGYVRLKKDARNVWKAFTLYTVLLDLVGHEERTGRLHGLKDIPPSSLSKDPSVLIVGGGQTGLILAARMKALRLNVLVVEKNEVVGDNWRKRYESLKLHTTATYASFPYQKFPEDAPTFLPKAQVADFLESYSVEQDLPIWTSAEFLPGATYDSSERLWSVTISKKGELINLRPKHLVLAIGPAAVPFVPDFEGVDKFSGTTYHSSMHKDPGNWCGKNAVVLGASVSGHDIALSLQKAGADVLMVQRSPMCVLRLSTVKEQFFDRVWPPDRPVTDSDFLYASTPLKVLMHIAATQYTPFLARYDKDMLEGLASAGFLVGWGEEGGLGPIGQTGLILTKFGHFYRDVGNAQMIIDGKVKIKAGVVIDEFESEGVRFSDGTFAQADVVVFATGYHSMRTIARQLLGDEIVDQTSEIWNLDAEGELRGVYRPTGHPGLWYASGAFDHVRYLGRLLALQLLAMEIGVYDE